MEYQAKLKKLLQEYIDRYEEAKDECYRNDTIIALYEELVPYLALPIEEIEEKRIYISILLNAIYNNDIYYKFYCHLLDSLHSGNKTDDLNNLITRIIREYIELDNANHNLKNSINRRKYLVSSARNAIISMKYQNIIINNKFDVENIKRIVSYFEIEGKISNRDELLLINEIELYNRRLISQNGSLREQHYTEELYEEIPNILFAGFQEHNHIEVSHNRKATLNKLADEIPTYIEYLEKEEIQSAIEGYRNYCDDDNEYQYIIIRVLDKYLDSLIDDYRILTNKEIYQIRKDRLEIINDYYKTLDKYLYMLNYYNTLSELQEMDIDEVVEDGTILNEEKRKIIFATSPSNPTKARILSDMEDIPYEYYDTILRLLTDFKFNQNTKDEYKFLSSNRKLSYYRELKSDQVRIVLKHIDGDIYCILGAFAKKANNDSHSYNQMAIRTLPDTSTPEKLNLTLKLGEIIQEEISKQVKDKGRKGKR